MPICGFRPTPIAKRRWYSINYKGFFALFCAMRFIDIHFLTFFLSFILRHVVQLTSEEDGKISSPSSKQMNKKQQQQKKKKEQKKREGRQVVSTRVIV